MKHSIRTTLNTYLGNQFACSDHGSSSFSPTLQPAIAIEAFYSVSNAKEKEISISKISWLVIEEIRPVWESSNLLVEVAHMKKSRKPTLKKI